jgi:hypothetical protein
MCRVVIRTLCWAASWREATGDEDAVAGREDRAGGLAAAGRDGDDDRR